MTGAGLSLVEEIAALRQAIDAARAQLGRTAIGCPEAAAITSYIAEREETIAGLAEQLGATPPALRLCGCDAPIPARDEELDRLCIRCGRFLELPHGRPRI